jgi:hypothetical protein
VAIIAASARPDRARVARVRGAGNLNTAYLSFEAKGLRAVTGIARMAGWRDGSRDCPR